MRYVNFSYKAHKMSNYQYGEVTWAMGAALAAERLQRLAEASVYAMGHWVLQKPQLALSRVPD